MNTNFDEANHSSRERNSDLEDRLCDLEQMVGIVDDLTDAALSDNSVYVWNAENGRISVDRRRADHLRFAIQRLVEQAADVTRTFDEGHTKPPVLRLLDDDNDHERSRAA